MKAAVLIKPEKVNIGKEDNMLSLCLGKRIADLKRTALILSCILLLPVTLLLTMLCYGVLHLEELNEQ
jgi:hypothetical protein